MNLYVVFDSEREHEAVYVGEKKEDAIKKLEALCRGELLQLAPFSPEQKNILRLSRTYWVDGAYIPEKDLFSSTTDIIDELLKGMKYWGRMECWEKE